MVYIDDIIVYSETIEEHTQHLKQAFDTSINFLGHTVSNGEIKPSEEKIEAIKSCKQPENVEQILAFIGMASHYRKFIKHFAKKASPLHELCAKNVKFNSDEKCQDAFDQLKNALTSESVLMIPDFEKRFYLETDASNKGIGAVLSQMDENNQLRPIAYYSRKLSKSEQNYSASEKEMLAIVNAIKELQGIPLWYRVYSHH
ncbi:unnamed protein product [Brachionus calyciflorus]|uniref:Reverse transcriptase/retrotransposon-derived protein RNase H-like domain-containing protein n=1 Tax=Brachionus calyciflorus TaxID=104777 RepID=A0A814BYD5_9BILA|nr:unnamed protein product [Brachionus calyciflorus]